ncbi:microtubule-actin cross-linking factor 1, isoforms 6/7-like [Ctenodactylus gundi]
MGKPLSRPDCLRRNPTCLGKGEDEDGYIEDCYVPQRSIYDTMRINEQIDQGSKLNQTSKSTMEKMEGSTISSNGTLGAASNVFESRAPEGKKLDERIIFDALKLSSDMQKSAPVPPRRRPNVERKDNVNRRSWKSFMPPNFPEFAERMEASLSEVSEAGASNPSLQERKESSFALTESSGRLNHREPQSESVTLEHVSKSFGIPEVQDVKNLSGDCQDFRFQQHSESSPHEFQPLESEAAAASGNTDVAQEHRFSSATWPRAMKSSAKGGFSEKQHPLGDTACTVEMPPLSPCLSEELLDPELHVLLTPSLREKTESELKFEEDERWIMMEAEAEWEEEKLSKGGKLLMTDENSLTDSFEEREQTSTGAVLQDGADCLAAALGTVDHLALGQICYSNDTQPARDHLTCVPKDTPLDCSYVLTDEGDTGEMKNRTAQGLEGLVSEFECNIGPVDAEQLSDTDSVQMFLELEKECLCEEGVTPSVQQQTQTSSERRASSQDTENSLLITPFPEAALEKEHHVDLLNVRVKDHDTGMDCEYFNALDSSQVPIAHTSNMRNTSTVSKECEKVPFSPKIMGEFKSPADLESLRELDLGGLPNSDHQAYCEENLSGFITSELAKENGNLSQADGSQTEENVECIDKFPLSFAFNYQPTDVISGSEAEVLPYDSNLLAGGLHLENEKEAINQENNSVTSSGNVDPCELSMQKVCDEDGKAKDTNSQTKLLGDEAPAHFLRDFPEQIFQDPQMKSPESEILSVHLLAGELKGSRDGVQTLDDVKPELNVASSQGGEMEGRDSDFFLNLSPEDQITKASDIEPVLEEWNPSLQRTAPTAAVPTVEDALDAAVPTLQEDISVVAVPVPEGPTASAAAESASEGTALVAVVVLLSEEHVPVDSVATLQTHVPAVSVVTLAEDVLDTAVSAPEGAALPALGMPASEGSVPIAAVFSPEETPVPAAAITEEDIPAVEGSYPEDTALTAALPVTEEDDTPESLAIPAAAVHTPEEPGSSAAAFSIPEESAALAAAVSTPEEPASLAFSGPIPEELANLALVGPTLEKPAFSAPMRPAPKEPAIPTVAPSPEDLDPPTVTVFIPEAAATPAYVGPTLEDSAAPPPTGLTSEEPNFPAAAVPTPEEPATLAATVPAMEEFPPTSNPSLGDTAHTDSVPISEEQNPVLKVSPTETWLKEDLDSSEFGAKEVTDTVLHEKVSQTTTDGLNSSEVIVAHFVAHWGLRVKGNLQVL